MMKEIRTGNNDDNNNDEEEKRKSTVVEKEEEEQQQQQDVAAGVDTEIKQSCYSKRPRAAKAAVEAIKRHHP